MKEEILATIGGIFALALMFVLPACAEYLADLVC